MSAEQGKTPMTPEEKEQLRQLLKSLPRDASGFSPILVELSDVLPALQGAFPPQPRRICTGHPLSACPAVGYCSLSSL